MEVQVETLDEGVIDSLKAPIQKVKEFLKRARINIQDKLSPDKKKIILNAAEVAIMFLPSLNSKLSDREIYVLEHIDDESPEKIAPVIYKIFKELSRQGYIEEDDYSFLIPRKMLINSSIAGFKARNNYGLQKDELISKIKDSDEKLKLVTNKLNKAQNDLDEAKQRYNDIAKSLDRIDRLYKKAYDAFTSSAGAEVLPDGIKSYKEISSNKIKELEEERERLSNELETYQREIDACNKEVAKCGKELLANRLEKDDLLQRLAGHTPTDEDGVSESITMAGVALSKVICNFILMLVGSILVYLVVDGWREDYFNFQREALRINKNIFSEFGVDIKVGPFSFKSKSVTGAGSMGESNLEVSKEVIDIEDLLVFDESEIDSLYHEDDVDESIIDGAISKAKLVKRIYKLFSIGAIRVIGSKIIIDTGKIGVQENV